MSDKNNISENNLDALLNNLFLENTGELQEDAAQFVLKQSYAPVMDAGKEKELIQKLNKKLKGPGGAWPYGIVLSVFIFAAGIFFYTKYESRKVAEFQKEAIRKKEDTLQEKPFITTHSHFATEVVAEKIKDNSSSEKNTNGVDQQNDKPGSKQFSTSASVYYPATGVGSKSTATFFKPTEQDFIFYDAYKKVMLENLLHTDKEMYSVVEQDNIEYHGKPVDVAPFILRNYTITNLEYKIFLADLIKKGKENIFKKVAVKNEAWIDYKDVILASTYFFEEKYNNFPVVNISPEAASLFCDWLETEINQYSKQLNSQAEPMNIRLPVDAELLLAEKNGYLYVPNCEGYQTIYEKKQPLIDDLFLSINKKSNEKKLQEIYSLNRYGMTENQTLQLFEKGIQYENKSTVGAVEQSHIGFVSGVAHVSEMVMEKGSKKLKIAGSCWKTKQDYMDMTKAFDQAGASPFVGFRVVIVYLEK